MPLMGLRRRAHCGEHTAVKQPKMLLRQGSMHRSIRVSIAAAQSVNDRAPQRVLALTSILANSMLNSRASTRERQSQSRSAQQTLFGD